MTNRSVRKLSLTVANDLIHGPVDSNYVYYLQVFVSETVATKLSKLKCYSITLFFCNMSFNGRRDDTFVGVEFLFRFSSKVLKLIMLHLDFLRVDI